MKPAWEVIFYEMPGGRCPVREFLCNLSADDRVRIDNKVSMLRTSGPSLRRPHAAKLEGDIWELRCKTKSGNYRLLYSFYSRHQAYVILHAILKKQGAVPRNAIEIAKKRMWDFLAEQG